MKFKLMSVFLIVLLISGAVGILNDQHAVFRGSSALYFNKTTVTLTKAILLDSPEIQEQAMRILCFLGFCSVLSPGLLGQGQKKGLNTVKQWHRLDYDFGSNEARDRAIADGTFVPGNGIPIDIDMNYRPNSQSRMFITVPRFQTGIPATLNTIQKNTSNVDPLLRPYPAWHWHQNSESCHSERLISVFRVQIDECNRLWVLDTGKIGSNQLCLPQILAFDLKTDRVLYRYEIPREQIRSTSILVTPVIDIRDSICSDTFVYAADVTGFGIIVLDVRRNRSWRVMNKYLYPVPDYGTFTIENESFDLMDGVLGMSITPYRPGEDRLLFFHALASNTENYVRTSLLRNQTIFENNEEAEPRSFIQIPRRRPSQSAAAAIDRNGVMYFGLLSQTSIACWNTQPGSSNSYQNSLDEVLERNSETLQFPSGVKIVNNLKGGQELWVSTCRFQKVMTGSMDQTNDINFRIQAVKIDDFVRGSKCQNIRPGGSNGGATQGGGYGLIKPQQIWSRSGGVELTGENTDSTSTASLKREVHYVHPKHTSDSIVFLDD